MSPKEEAADALYREMLAAGVQLTNEMADAVNRFARKAVAAERAACIVVCEKHDTEDSWCCANQIRARGTK